MRLQCALYLILIRVKLYCILLLFDICVVYMLSYYHVQVCCSVLACSCSQQLFLPGACYSYFWHKPAASAAAPSKASRLICFIRWSCWPSLFKQCAVPCSGLTFHIVQLRNIIKDCLKNLKLVRVLYLHRRLRIQDIT